MKPGRSRNRKLSRIKKRKEQKERERESKKKKWRISFFIVVWNKESKSDNGVVSHFLREPFFH